MMKKALGTAAERTRQLQEEQLKNSIKEQVPKKKIGKSPLIGQPRLFGGKLVEYLNVLFFLFVESKLNLLILIHLKATKQEIPLIITSCIKAINRLGLHNQGIFRIPGSLAEINQFKESFEKGIFLNYRLRVFAIKLQKMHKIMLKVLTYVFFTRSVLMALKRSRP